MKDGRLFSLPLLRGGPGRGVALNFLASGCGASLREARATPHPNPPPQGGGDGERAYFSHSCAGSLWKRQVRFGPAITLR